MTPPDTLILLATYSAAQDGRLFPGDGWTDADRVARTLRRLGHHKTAQQVAAYLGRLVRQNKVQALRPECEPLDTRLEYRIDDDGRRHLDRELPGVRLP